MSHKDAPPLTAEQTAFETFWIELKGPKFCGYGRDKAGSYLAEFVRDAFTAWQASAQPLAQAAQVDAEKWRKHSMTLNRFCWQLSVAMGDVEAAAEMGKVDPDALLSRVIAHLGVQSRAVSDEWRPMESAPRDGSMLRLLVEFEDHATEDTAGPAPTIGAYCAGAECWHFAGWCWTHDHFTEGKGTPVGWLPMLAAALEADRG
jgi:hypothetical protein